MQEIVISIDESHDGPASERLVRKVDVFSLSWRWDGTGHAINDSRKVAEMECYESSDHLSELTAPDQ
jgi:hypothetical protein